MEKWQLKQRQSLPLEVKILMSQRRIIEAYEEYDGQLYISNSGGKDSKSPNRFERMKTTHSSIYDYCIRSIDNGGLGLGDVLDFIGVSY